MSEKLKMMSPDITQENIKKIQKIFPNCVTEVIGSSGELKRAIDFDALKQELSEVLIDDKQERYQMTWPDKKKSILLANNRSNATLRPDKNKSVNFDNTKNIYIEGDNLEILKLLRETYLNKVKLIYIDPPYNTGNDFIYDDNYTLTLDDYLHNSGQLDERENKLFSNTEANGRFHTDWLNLIYPRLKVARDLMSDDGTIFISIDVNEQHNLRKICDEIFGASNFVTDIIWNSRKSVSNDAVVSLNHNYTLVYTKDMSEFYKNRASFKLPDKGEGFENPDNDPRGKWKADPFDSPGIRPNLTYKIVNPNTGKEYWPPEGRCWRTGEKEYNDLLADNRIVFGVTGKSGPQLKRFYTDAKEKGVTPKSLWDDCGTATEGTKELLELFGAKVFDTPKPVKFIKKIIQLASEKNDIVMDFFSGSGTLGQAVMECNSEEGNRQFILIQLDENLDNSLSSATSADAKGIIKNAISLCDKIGEEHNLAIIGEERIRRAGKQIKEEWEKDHQNEGLFADESEQFPVDIGFRVLKLDSSNMNDVYYNPNTMNQTLLESTVDNVKPGRTGLDLLFQVMLELGVELSAKIEEKLISGKQCFVVNENDIVACFDDMVTDEVTRELAQIKPIYAVFKDSSFESDSSNINCEQIFKSVSPTTTIKVI